MAMGHQLKKLAQTRAAHTKHRWIDYMPKHWSVYTLIFSTASLVVFCFLFYDMQSSPTSLLLHAGRELGALRAQVGESYLFSRSRSSPTEIVTGVDENGKDWAARLSKDSELSNLDKKRVAASSREERVDTTQHKIQSDELIMKESESKARPDPSSTALEDDLLLHPGQESEEVVVIEEESIEKATPEEVESFNLDKSAEDLLGQEGVSSDLSVPDESCDFSVGKWVYDENYPLYKPNTCPFLDGGFRCVENGRPSSDFQKWRWQPAGCDLPRFDAKEMLERMRGTRMVFVGDSIGRNNWESMLCMLSEAVQNKSRVYEINGEPISKHSGYLIFRFEDYNCTVEYYRSPYLVPQGRGPPNSDPRVRSTLKLDIMDWSSSKWREADIVILNSGHWWSFEKTVRGGNYFQEEKKVYLNMSVGDALGKAMQTVANFADKSMDAAKSQVFFRSYAPVHFKGGTWDHGGTCHDDSKPLEKFPFVYQDKTANGMILGIMTSNMNNRVGFLNITYLSDLRPDGHSSIWQRVPNSPKNHQDCSHWCLPGVPDTWNEILFATLLREGKGVWGNHAKLKS